MRLTIESLLDASAKAVIMAGFRKPWSKEDIHDLRNDGFSSAMGLAASFIKWVWFQWLLHTPAGPIRSEVKAFVDTGISLQNCSTHHFMRPHADLYLLHCAIFGSTQDQLESLAGRVVDTSGVHGHKPVERHGELYASAWCGMLKHWILGDTKRALQESEIIWGAYRDASFAAASKPLVTPWLKGDWKAFRKAQQKDFDKLWARARKDGTVRSQSGDEEVVTVQMYPVEQKWCWAHCGLALLAYRRGIEVATDPFWFPPHALHCIPK